MLFNSVEFIFVFLPVTLGLFLVFGRSSRKLALGWLGAASLGFYAWWRPLNILIIGPVFLLNYVLAKWLTQLDGEGRPGLRKAVLAFGITVNVVFLAYFKYVDFVLFSINELTGTHFALTHVILPLAISFVTFQLIAFLVDVHGGRVTTFTFREFCLFVLFFPQLIAGPIVHFREMMPQFRSITGRFDGEDVSVGLTVFVFGLFKKVVLADGLAIYVTPIFEHAASGGPVPLLHAWIAALGFTFQIYFDFSGYSEMAVGLARCFGVRLPINFDSPLKAKSVVEHWQRWHITLTRFLTAYVYNPIVLRLSRRRASQHRSVVGGPGSSLETFVELLAGPTILTMLIAGLWHGTGYTFMLWGLLHGVYLVVNHASRSFGPRLLASKERYQRLVGPVALPITFLSVAVAMVMFRATTVRAAIEVLEGMTGMNGLALPPALIERLGGVVAALVQSSDVLSATEFVVGGVWVLAAVVIVFGLPNVLQIMAEHKPVLDGPRVQGEAGWLSRSLRWRPSLAWALVVVVLGAIALMRLGGPSEFLYWQF